MNNRTEMSFVGSGGCQLAHDVPPWLNDQCEECARSRLNVFEQDQNGVGLNDIKTRDVQTKTRLYAGDGQLSSDCTVVSKHSGRSMRMDMERDMVPTKPR